MSLQCQLNALFDKLSQTLAGLYCLEEGAEQPWPQTLNSNEPIACQLATLVEMQCLAADQVVCECEAEACFSFKGFDYANPVSGFWDSGSYGATVNGVATNTPWNFTTDAGKAAAYQAMIDQVNATAGWSLTVVNDASMNTNDLVEFQAKYCGPAGEAAVLDITRTTGTNGDQLILDANAGQGKFVDSGGNEISNDRQPLAC